MKSERSQAITTFVEYVRRHLRGYEKGEAQIFCDRLFQAFGHEGVAEAGATLEYRVKRGRAKSTSFADLRWADRVLIEMKSRGEKLQRHYDQAFQYWTYSVPHRPRYVVLCNFDEFWIYDFNAQLHEPVDRVRLEELEDRYTALNFLYPEELPPQFGNDRVAVTREAAATVARVFQSLLERKTDREQAQRFILQCVVALFAEDIELIPRGLFTRLVQECIEGASSYDLLGGLFRQMNTRTAAPAGKYRHVPHFNGGLFSEPVHLHLERDELNALALAGTENWSKVEPAIFGTLFQGSIEKGFRHAHGAHFTADAEIQRAVGPTIIQPWKERIDTAKTFEQLQAVRQELLNFRVLDPACGSGNFLYVAYRALKRLELQVISRIHTEFKGPTRKKATRLSRVSVRQFFGMDVIPFAVELAKVTLMLGKKLAIDEAQDAADSEQLLLPLEIEPALPFDDLDDNIVCADALFTPWKEVDACSVPSLSRHFRHRDSGVSMAKDPVYYAAANAVVLTGVARRSARRSLGVCHLSA